VTSYNDYAKAANPDNPVLYDPTAYDPIVGYDPALAGAKPYPLEDPPGLYAYVSSIKKPPFDWWAATDSASAATAMSTGFKTDDGNIAWLPGDPDNGELETVGEAVHSARGMSYGVVSTQAISAATPAAFASHNKDRKKQTQITDEMVIDSTNLHKPDVVIGVVIPGRIRHEVQLQRHFSQYLRCAEIRTNRVCLRGTATDINTTGGAVLLDPGGAVDQAIAQGKKLFGLFA